MNKTKSFSIQAILRDYIYTVKVDTVTGKIVTITAGCRCWTSLEQAIAHYNGVYVPHNGQSWRDDTSAHLGGPARADSTKYFFWRKEARIILGRLATRVYAYQNYLARRATRAEQASILAKKPVKKVTKKIAKKVAKKKIK